MDLITDPFASESIRTAAVAAAVVGVLCGVVGSYVVLRGLAIMAEGLAHGVMPGVGIAFALTVGAAGDAPDDTAITIGALIAALVTAGATSVVLARTRLREDTAAAVVFVFMLALGVAIVTGVQEGTHHDAHQLEEFLFGDVLAVSWGEIAVTAALTAVVLGLVAVLYRPFLLLSFDRKRATAIGLPVDRLQLAMFVVLALAVVVGFRVVGALLVIGLLIAPAAAAALVTKRLPAMMAVAAAIAALSGPLGLIASWHLDVAAGPAIVIVAVAAFAAVAVVRPEPR